MGAITTKPLTIEEFDKLDLPDDRQWELHNGEVVDMGQPTFIHRDLQNVLKEILDPLFPGHRVMIECPFKVESTNDERSADVAVVEKARAQRAREKNILDGTPELVIEVLSPSNSATEMIKYRRLCFANQTLAFWLVDSDNSAVEVSLKGQPTVTYELSDSIPISLFGVQASIPVRDIFAGITLS
jgi:Uma2 family endonuclease